MSKYQEALDDMSYHAHDYCGYENDYNSLQELVDKEKPKAVVGDGDDHSCSNCGEYFCICEVNNKINYCPNCGQKLDWNGGEENANQ